MAQTKYLTSKNQYTQLDILKNQTQEIGFPNEKITNEFGEDLIVAIENYNRNPIKIIYDGEKIYIENVYEDSGSDTKEILRVFNGFYVRGFSKIIQEVGQLPFVLFGEFVPENRKNSFVIYDMYINDNWISHKDLTKIVTNNGFTYPRIIFHGLYDEDVIKKVMSRIPSASNKEKKVEYSFVKPEMEVSFSYKRERLGTIVSAFIASNKEKQEQSKETRNRAYSILSSYLFNLIDATVFSEWRNVIEKEGLEINQENKPLILSFLVENSLNDIQVDIHEMSKRENINIDILEEVSKKILPKYIMKALNFR